VAKFIAPRFDLMDLKFVVFFWFQLKW
jgi:hypothetical protein